MNWDLIITIGVAALAATWALRSKLSDIETKLGGHVERTQEQHTELERRVVKLEDYRKGRV